jgi:YggT family protein
VQIICSFLTIYLVVIFARILLSWVRITPDSAIAPIAAVVVSLTDPVMSPLRRAIPPVRMGAAALDLSPIVLIIGLQILIGAIC